MFPSKWLEPPINVKVKPLSANEFKRSRRIILDALEKYPEEVVRDNLKEVYALKYLEFYDIEAGGTNSRNQVYVISKGLRAGYTADWIEKVFHAEFSSILLRNYSERFGRKQWKEINGMSFNYGRGGVDAIGSKKAQKKLDSSLNNKGFLHEYARSSLENDFNSFAEYMFLGQKSFWELISSYPKLEKKRDQFIEFYKRIHPSFTHHFFKNLSFE
jgi:hypothetical protein